MIATAGAAMSIMTTVMMPVIPPVTPVIVPPFMPVMGRRMVMVNNVRWTDADPAAWMAGAVSPVVISAPFVQDAEGIIAAPVAVGKAYMGFNPDDAGINVVIITAMGQHGSR